MKLSAREKIGYGLGDTASNLVWGILMSFIMYYYTDVYGISAAVVGTMFLFARIFDGVTDFMMGAIADRTDTRWGKFRPYLLWMALPLGIVTVLTFTVPGFGTSGKVIYAWITYNLLMAFYAAINIPYSALSGVMTDDPSERTSLNSWRMVLAQCGGFIVNGATLPLVAYFGSGDEVAGFQKAAALYAIVATLLFCFAFTSTKERIRPVVRKRTNLWGDLKRISTNHHWWIMFFTGMLDLTFVIVRSGSLFYYAKYVMGLDEGRTTLFLLLGNIGFVLGAMVARPIVSLLGKKNTAIVAHGVMAVFALAVYWVPPSQVALIFALQLMHAAGGGVNAVLFFAMVADSADYSEWRSGMRDTGIVFSATTCAQKIGMGMGGALAGLFMSGFGYVANQPQSTQSMQGIVLLVSIIPAVGFAVSGILFTWYGLTETMCANIRNALAERRSLAEGEVR